MDVTLIVLFGLLAIVIMFGIAGMAQMLHTQKPAKNAGGV
jgi:hypothetical protein